MATSDVEMTGTIVKFFPGKGYGFIRSDLGGDLFFHVYGQYHVNQANNLTFAMSRKTPVEYDRVVFRIGPSDKPGQREQARMWGVTHKVASPAPVKRGLPMTPPLPPPKPPTRTVEPIELVIFRVAAGDEWVFRSLLDLANKNMRQTTMQRFCRAAELSSLTGAALRSDYMLWKTYFGLKDMEESENLRLFAHWFIGASEEALAKDAKEPGCCGRCHPPT